MHNLMVVGFTILVAGGIIALTDDSLADTFWSRGRNVLVAVLVGLVATFVVVQRVADVIPDEVETWLSPIVAVAITAWLALIGLRRHGRL